MGKKGTPQNRGKVNTKKMLNGKAIEPIVIYMANGKKFKGAKISKTTTLIKDEAGNLIPWEKIDSE